MIYLFIFHWKVVLAWKIRKHMLNLSTGNLHWKFVIDWKFVLASFSSESVAAAASNFVTSSSNASTSAYGDDEESGSADRPSSYVDDFGTINIQKARKVSGWADDPIKPQSKGSNKSATTINIIEQERFNSASLMANLSDDDIPVIPDLDDIKDEAMLNEMAEAPTVSVNRVAAYNELNSDLLKLSAFSTLEDVDLSILVRSCVQNDKELIEPDDVWTWEKLFTDVTADINGEMKQPPKSADIQIQTQFVH